ncbi:MAG: hypothetical protein HY000_00545 [Planctomycetes bacterium]|nr:hypothetical protein [Planctomycetota bacterium]
MRNFVFTLSAVLALANCSPAVGQIERVWLTHRTNDTSRIIINWTSKQPGDSVIRFGATPDYGQMVRVDERTLLHHVGIPLTGSDAVFHYRVSSGDQVSPDWTFKRYPSDQLRVAVVANWQGRSDLTAIQQDNPHLLLTAGDNVSSIHELCGSGNKDCTRPYAALIDAYPDRFAPRRSCQPLATMTRRSGRGAAGLLPNPSMTLKPHHSARSSTCLATNGSGTSTFRSLAFDSLR